MNSIDFSLHLHCTDKAINLHSISIFKLAAVDITIGATIFALILFSIDGAIPKNEESDNALIYCD